MSEEMKICISSPPDRERMVAEVFAGDEQWAELNQESERLVLEIYLRRAGKVWELDFEEALNALLKARRRLIGA